ncbi:MAG: phytanoyl-CoA dioxygenase family protein [Pseudomonadales bacterium]|nr:phytanoyl-CoA dioxygenase family protein [Pseudomonadales bacterium]
MPVAPLRNVTGEERNALAQEGVAILRDVLPEAWIEPLRGAVENLLANPDYLERGQTEQSAQIMGGAMINGFLGWLYNEVFAALAIHSPVSEIAKQLLAGQSVQHFYDPMFVKRPGIDAGTPWHRDRGYYSINGTDFVSVWFHWILSLPAKLHLPTSRGHT